MKLKKLAILLLVFLLLLSQTTLIMARAGGGHGSRSSGGFHSSWGGGSNHSWSTGSHYYGGGGGGGSLPIPIIIIIVVIVIVVILLSNNNKKQGQNAAGSYLDNESPDLGEDAPAVQRGPDLSVKLQALKEKDPGFNQQVFEDKVATSFFEIQRAWSKRDMSVARDFVSDTVFHRFSIQLEEYASKNWTSQMEELSLDKVEVLDLRSDERYDIIDVWITATARDYILDSLGKIVSGSRELVTWDEKWSFVRSLKTQTLMKEGAKSYQCPNCGSPVRMNASGECEYCHSSLTKYDFDWVLSEITQLNQ